MCLLLITNNMGRFYRRRKQSSSFTAAAAAVIKDNNAKKKAKQTKKHLRKHLKLLIDILPHKCIGNGFRMHTPINIFSIREYSPFSKNSMKLLQCHWYIMKRSKKYTNQLSFTNELPLFISKPGIRQLIGVKKFDELKNKISNKGGVEVYSCFKSKDQSYPSFYATTTHHISSYPMELLKQPEIQSKIEECKQKAATDLIPLWLKQALPIFTTMSERNKLDKSIQTVVTAPSLVSLAVKALYSNFSKGTKTIDYNGELSFDFLNSLWPAVMPTNHADVKEKLMKLFDTKIIEPLLITPSSNIKITYTSWINQVVDKCIQTVIQFISSKSMRLIVKFYIRSKVMINLQINLIYLTIDEHEKMNSFNDQYKKNKHKHKKTRKKLLKHLQQLCKNDKKWNPILHL